MVFELARGDVEAGGMKDWRVNDSGVLFVGFVGVVGEGCWERSWIGDAGERRSEGPFEKCEE